MFVDYIWDIFCVCNIGNPIKLNSSVKNMNS